MLHLTINGKAVEVPEGSTIMEAAEAAGVKVPSLCHMKNVHQYGSCRICVVEVEGMKNLQASCMVKAREGMKVKTHSPKVLAARKVLYELLLSNHPKDCLSCNRNQSCELQELGYELGVTESRFEGAMSKSRVDISPSITRDTSKCILCRRCVAACQSQHVSVIGANNRGFDTEIGCAFEKPLGDVACVACGQCIVSCPTGALTEKDNTQEVLDAIHDPDKVVIVQTAPAVRAALGEEFGLPIGTNVEGKMVAALRRLGFDKVFDTDFGADMTIMEEATEFIHRVKNGGTLPMITSCSPGWVRYLEQHAPDMIRNISSCKSPQQMFGSLVKTYYAEQAGMDPQDIFVVSIMPCTAKKFEIKRDDEDAAGLPDVDISITTRELARLIKKAQLNFNRLPEEKFDDAMGVSTGAAVIFGATGGVMEAALRTAADLLTGESQEAIEYTEIRGTEGFKEAVYKVAGMDVKVAVVSGLSNADALLQKVRAGEADYQFIEVMCCPGGCVNGGGQPVQSSVNHSFYDIKKLRAQALYDQDKSMPLRKSHLNPVLQKCYEEFLGEPGSHKAHEVLHTSYVKRGY